MDWDPEEAHEIVSKLERLGVMLRLHDGELVVEGRFEAVSRKSREQLRRRRLDLVASLELRARGLREEGVRRLLDGRVLYRHPPLERPTRRQTTAGWGDWW
jgi:hypothetical protein